MKNYVRLNKESWTVPVILTTVYQTAQEKLVLFFKQASHQEFAFTWGLCFHRHQGGHTV